MTVTIYHNPGCSKSRQTLQLLKEQGIEPTVVEYLVNPPTASELQEIIAVLEVNPRDMIRKNEQVYTTSGAHALSLSDTQLIELMIQYPELIERPIVLANGKAAMGRPPENVLGII